MSTVARFRKAVAGARHLPPDLLTQGQKLKLFALYQQSHGPAPAEEPAGANALMQAKWEAWRDVRGLSKEQAMESYSQIIEGLVTMLKQDAAQAGSKRSPPAAGRAAAVGDPFVTPAPMRPVVPPTTTVRSPPPKPSPPRAAPAVSKPSAQQQPPPQQAQPQRSPRHPPQQKPGARPGADSSSADEGLPAGGGGGAEDERAPKVDRIVWSTEGVDLSAGTTFSVPLMLSCPSRCSYDFAIVSGTGPIGFKLLPDSSMGGSPRTPQADAPAPLLDVYESAASGSLELSPGAGGVLVACLDNSGSMLTTISVRCQVTLEPLDQLERLALYEARAALRERRRAAERRIGEAEEEAAALGGEAVRLRERAEQLSTQLEQVRASIDRREEDLRASAKEREALHAEIEAITCQLAEG